MQGARIAVATGLLSLVAAAPAAPPPAKPAAPAAATTLQPPALAYVTRAGDTLAALAGKALVHPRDWQALARINHVADPRRLAIGRVLTIPAVLLRREALTASIAAFSGQVAVVPGGAARVGAAIGEGAVLQTGANSFVTLALSDGSRVTLPSQSRVRIEALQRVVLDGRLERRFAIEAGRGDFGVTPRERDTDRFLVRTPVAVAAVRGTEFRVAHDDRRASSVIGVVEGNVAGRAQAARAEIAVPAGAGAVIGIAAARTAVLLPPPGLEHPGRVQDDPVVLLTTDRTPGVVRRVQLARDAGFIDLFAETETATNDARFENVANGTIYARLTAIDGDGVEGLPASYAIERFLSGIDASAGAMPGPPRRTLFRWQPSGSGTRSYDFVLARDAALVDRIIDAPGLAGTEMTVTGLAPGSWFWRVTVTASDGGKRFTRVFPVRTLTIAAPER